MILDRLSSYLQNQPFKATETEKTEAVKPSVLADTSDEKAPEELHLSNRAAYLEYLSHEFDVTSLNPEQLNELQSKLSDYGFIENKDLNGMRSLALAKQMTNADETVNAVDLLSNFQSRFDELQIPYSMRQQVDKMSIVIQNMASAREFPGQTRISA